MTSANPKMLHVICERDVGLFSLIQQVVANVPWALAEGRIPVAFFGRRCCYWTPAGHEGRATVWEYYFEPVVEEYPASSVPEEVVTSIEDHPPASNKIGYAVNDLAWVSNHFGDHPDLEGRTVPVPYGWEDPPARLRRRAGRILAEYVRPRRYLAEKIERFRAEHLAGATVIGVHMRGTDTTSRREMRPHRFGSFSPGAYARAIRARLAEHPDARIFLASDDEASVDLLRSHFGDRVIVYDSVRHRSGKLAARGPGGWYMPGYIANDREVAARNGEEAVIECWLLARSDVLIHNGSGLARTALLIDPELPHVNTHAPRSVLARARSFNRQKLRWALAALRERLGR